MNQSRVVSNKRRNERYVKQYNVIEIKSVGKLVYSLSSESNKDLNLSRIAWSKLE